MVNGIDRDMLSKLGGPGNTAGTYTHERSRPLNQSEQNPSNKMRISNLVDRKTSLPVTQDAADQRATQIRDIQTRPQQVQQLTPSASSHRHKTPVSSVTSRTTHAGSESTTRTQADQSRISIPSAPTLLPRKVEDPKGQYPTEPIRQKVTNDRPALSHHREAGSLSSSQNSLRPLAPKESVISGPSSEPQQNIAGPVDMTQSRPLRPMIICEQCGRSYKDPTGYSNHRRKKLSLPCPESSCGHIFCTKDYLEKHVREEHNKKVHYCTSCLSQKQYVIYTNPLQLRNHIKLKHPNEI